jgi:indole-3-glycerol phosphate synthase
LLDRILMTNKLIEICATKRDHVARRKAETSLAELQARAAAQTPPRGFRAALDAKVAQGGYGLIAEIKKASPSKGLIRADFDPPAHALAYLEGGAACLSVLTDEPYFQGSDEYLIAARAAVPLPCLRKDFMIDPWQVTEARALGADAILIIVAALDERVHAMLDRALRLRSRLIGVNNRDLRTFTVDFARTYELAGRAPAGCTFVAESGLGSKADLDAMADHGVRCFLVGESLMRQADVTAATARLLTGA